MDHEYTIRVNKENILVTLKQVGTNKWKALAEYKGKKYETSADTPQNAHEELTRKLGM